MSEYKNYRLVADETGFSMVRVQAKGKGTIPDALKGLYTSKTAAMNAIDGYLNSLMKGKRNGKTESTSSA